MRNRTLFILIFVQLIKIIIIQSVRGQFIDDTNTVSIQKHHQNQLTELTTDTGGYKCEALNTDVVPLCKDIAYNETRFPNFLKQKSQQEAATETNIYLPLIRINCSPVLKLFLCSLYVPPCIRNYSSTLRPCRELCEKAKTGCEDFMKRFQFVWPDYIDCYRFPPFSGPEACIIDDNYSTSNNNHNGHYSFINQQHKGLQSTASFALQPSSSGSNLNSNKLVDSSFLAGLSPTQQQILLNSLTSVPSLETQNKNYMQLYAAAVAALAAAAVQPTSVTTGLTSLTMSANPRIRFICPPALQLLTDTKNTYYLNLQEDSVANCAMPCDNSLFDRSEIEFARSWVLIWSSLCFSSTLFTILTFIIESSRFRYPERPIIFLSGCYMMVALGYLLGSSSLTSNSIVCRVQKNALMQLRDYLVQGVEHVPCTLLFMLIYFFGMSACVWWVVLTLTWFLAAGLKWGHEAIESISSYFHLAAWAIPGVKMIALLWLQKIDADILSGTCFTGIRNMSIMKGFVLAPLCLYLILGTCFLLAGFVSLIRIRNVMKHDGNHTGKLEKFMVRIGVFSILYMVPAIIVICCYFYEQSAYPKWIDYWLKKNSLEFNLPPDYVSNSLFEIDRSAVVYSLFMIKYAMVLVVGITSGFWIWSHKTIASWQRFYDRVFVCFDSFKPKYKNEAAV